MPQKYKVFFNHNVVYLSNQFSNDIEKVNQIINPDEAQIKHIIQLFATSKSSIEFVLIFDDLKAGWKLFKKQFLVRKAAGGLVQNADNELLFIKRKGFWDLPKGHIEKNEKKKIAALREVSEECGIGNLLLERKLLTTYHTYFLNGQLILKPSHWYLMSYADNEALVPQTEEGITEVKWISLDNLVQPLKNSFPSIVDVVASFTGAADSVLYSLKV